MATPPVFSPGAVLLAAQQNLIGQWVTKPKTSFTTATSVVADDVFSADFDTYLVVVRYTTTTTTGVSLRLRDGGVSAATNYNTTLVSTTPTLGVTTAAAATSWAGCMLDTDGNFPSVSFILLSGPFLAAQTTGWSMNSNSVANVNTMRVRLAAFNHSTASSFDGMELLIGTGTTTGNYTVYGMRM
jgi:hypothetical protein